jgi:hypothetical protein
MRVLVAAVLLASCSEHAPVVSSDVGTRDMGVDVDVRDEGAGRRATVRTSGPGGLVTLVDGDRWIVDTASGSRELAPASRGVATTLLDPGDLDLRFRLPRPGDHQGSFRVLLPPPAAPLDVPATFSRASGLTVRWPKSDAGHETTVAVRGRCVVEKSLTIPRDAGEAVFTAADIRGPSPATCDVTVSVTRTQRTTTEVLFFRSVRVLSQTTISATIASVP